MYSMYNLEAGKNKVRKKRQSMPMMTAEVGIALHVAN